MKRRDFIREIEASGWSLMREGADHAIYEKKGHQYAVPRHREVKPGIVSGWKKRNKEIDDDK